MPESPPNSSAAFRPSSFSESMYRTLIFYNHWRWPRGPGLPDAFIRFLQIDVFADDTDLDRSLLRRSDRLNDTRPFIEPARPALDVQTATNFFIEAL